MLYCLKVTQYSSSDPGCRDELNHKKSLLECDRQVSDYTMSLSEKVISITVNFCMASGLPTENYSIHFHKTLYIKCISVRWANLFIPFNSIMYLSHCFAEIIACILVLLLSSSLSCFYRNQRPQSVKPVTRSIGLQGLTPHGVPHMRSFLRQWVVWCAPSVENMSQGQIATSLWMCRPKTIGNMPYVLVSRLTA